MYLFEPTQSLFFQLEEVLEQLSITEYTAKGLYLSGATIGQHVRHIIELFQELDKGRLSGLVNYEARQRDYKLETNKIAAIAALKNLLHHLNASDMSLLLTADVSLDGQSAVTLKTTFYREWLYNIEHTVHHMALIRVGIIELTNIELPADFGIAASTIKHHKKTCAQ